MHLKQCEVRVITADLAIGESFRDQTVRIAVDRGKPAIKPRGIET